MRMGMHPPCLLNVVFKGVPTTLTWNEDPNVDVIVECKGGDFSEPYACSLNYYDVVTIKVNPKDGYTSSFTTDGLVQLEYLDGGDKYRVTSLNPTITITTVEV